MRTKTIVIVEIADGFKSGTYCNHPDLTDAQLKGAIEKGKAKTPGFEYHEVRYETMEECGCCGAWHRPEFNGDCRDDDERFYPMD